jgi:hypothetical protein
MGLSWLIAHWGWITGAVAAVSAVIAAGRERIPRMWRTYKHLRTRLGEYQDCWKQIEVANRHVAAMKLERDQAKAECESMARERDLARANSDYLTGAMEHLIASGERIDKLKQEGKLSIQESSGSLTERWPLPSLLPKSLPRRKRNRTRLPSGSHRTPATTDE